MADIEKVIKILERYKTFRFDDYPNKPLTVEGIIELLKEQEAVKPKKTAYQRADNTIAYRYRCGTCDMSIFPSFKYCPFCGQAVKWNE